MHQMNPRLRLVLCAVIIILSAGYAVLVEEDQGLAEVVALGYIGVLITILALVNLWKKA